MNIPLRLSILILIISLKSCNTFKTGEEKQSKGESIVKNNDVNKTLIEEGYSIGRVKYISDSQCSYIIIDREINSEFDPINLEEKKYLPFRKDSMIIYYKYRRLRMPYRCDVIQPIELIDIKKEKH